MCEFCHKHGEGKRWYLQAKNYSDDLLSDLRRRNFISEFFAHPEVAREREEKTAKLEKVPGFVRKGLTWQASNKMKKVHFGQVVPIEEMERIFDFLTSIFRYECWCRRTTVGSKQRYCYGVSMAPEGGKLAEIIRKVDPSYLTGPDTTGLEEVGKEEALTAFRDYEKQGLCHTVWTFHAPFIGGFCNCDRSDCFAMRFTVLHGMPIMFRGEYVAEVDPDLCKGCRECMRVCQFGAIGFSVAQKKVNVDPRRCYGCGICRSVCAKDAILLHDRIAVPVAAKIW